MAQFQFICRLDLTDDLTIDTSLLTAIGQFCGLHTFTIYTEDNCSHLQDCLHALIELDIKGRASHIQLFLSATSPSLLQRLSLFLCNPGTELLVQCISSIPTFVPAMLSTLALKSFLKSPGRCSGFDCFLLRRCHQQEKVMRKQRHTSMKTSALCASE